MDKKTLRKEILQKRDSLAQETRTEYSSCITQLLVNYPVFACADDVLLFAAFRSEVDTMELFFAAVEAGKRVYFPKVLGDQMEFYRVERESDFESGQWGIREPKMEEIKKYIPLFDRKICVIMPGAVFDEEGNRIGYGRGYYDKYLHRLSLIVPEGAVAKIGLAFECQLVEKNQIRPEIHDIALDYIITEERILVC